MELINDDKWQLGWGVGGTYRWHPILKAHLSGEFVAVKTEELQLQKVKKKKVSGSFLLPNQLQFLPKKTISWNHLSAPLGSNRHCPAVAFHETTVQPKCTSHTYMMKMVSIYHYPTQHWYLELSWYFDQNNSVKIEKQTCKKKKKHNKEASITIS